MPTRSIRGALGVNAERLTVWQMRVEHQTLTKEDQNGNRTNSHWIRTYTGDISIDFAKNEEEKENTDDTFSVMFFSEVIRTVYTNFVKFNIDEMDETSILSVIDLGMIEVDAVDSSPDPTAEAEKNFDRKKLMQ